MSFIELPLCSCVAPTRATCPPGGAIYWPSDRFQELETLQQLIDANYARELPMMARPHGRGQD